ncbi:MAG: ABC transporter ATP-binding protein/permease [Clostridia bacterium]|nr:ABC transporter ATP-binding protein/permease [Clostridia bacterium]
MFSKIKTINFFLKGSKRYFALAIIFVFLQVIFDLVNPKIMGYTVDYIVGDTSQTPKFILSFLNSLGDRDYVISHIWIISIIVVLIGLLSALSRYFFRVSNSIGGESLAKNMRDNLFSHILHLPYKWNDVNKTGDIIQRCTSDVDTIRNFVQEQLVNLVRMVAMIALALLFMFRIHVVLTLVSCFFIAIVIGYSLSFHGKVGEKFAKVDAEEGRLSSTAQENLEGVRVVRAFGREIFELERFKARNEVYVGHWVEMMSILATFWTISDFIKNALTISILALGAYFTISGQISAGQYVSYIAYVLMIIQPIVELGRVISDMSKSGVSIDRLKYILDSEIEKDPLDAIDFPPFGDVEFKNVSFSYNESLVLDSVNMSIKKGQTVGILGGTGSGKSTSMLLLDGLYDVLDGSITINGVDIKTIKKSELRQHIGFVLQEPYLFSRSLRDNITIASEKTDNDSVENAVKVSSLTSTIEKFKDGYNTFVGERGVTLSGGQRQRTAIAQMLIREPDIMIFDDSLSAVDAKTDASIRKELKRIAKDKTVIIISHRITTLMSADNIYVFDGGKIAESGSHDDLVSQGGIYSKIFDLQRSVQEA